MILMLRTLTLLIILPLLCSAQSEIKTERFANGNLQSEICYQNGVKHGISKYYYESGKVQSEFNYVDDRSIGFYRSFYENGQLEWEGSFKEEGKSGVWKRFTETGLLAETGIYLNNVRDWATWKLFDINGETDNLNGDDC
jgi:antitoxin component YwqK of YwqJK toxin-antitoxin module